jgi:hypothetical protein
MLARLDGAAGWRPVLLTSRTQMSDAGGESANLAAGGQNRRDLQRRL